MTDNEIIKAFEMHLLDNRDCEFCPYGPADYRCDIKLLKDALSLINRQKAQISQLKLKLDDLKRDDLPRCKDALRRANEIGMDLEKENQELKAEIEGLHKEVGYWEAETKEARADIDQAVVEAIKEFAERLKSRFLNKNEVINNAIDNLVKEMVGDESA